MNLHSRLLKECYLEPTTPLGIAEDLVNRSLDGRIKVLWFEDEKSIEFHPHIANYFQIVQARFPDAAASLLSRQLSEIESQRGASTYELPFFPFDIYVADRRLQEWRLGNNSQRLHQWIAPNQVQFATLSKAEYAAAPGVTSATLCAQRFPRHPACVLQYTAYEELTADDWSLLKLFAPECFSLDNPLAAKAFNEFVEGLGIANEDESKTANIMLILRAAWAFRRELIISFTKGRVLGWRSEFARVKALLQAARNNQSFWPDDAAIHFQTHWGKRKFLLTSLFPEQLHPLIDLQPDVAIRGVENWLNEIEQAVANRDNLFDMVSQFAQNWGANRQRRRELAIEVKHCQKLFQDQATKDRDQLDAAKAHITNFARSIVGTLDDSIAREVAIERIVGIATGQASDEGGDKITWPSGYQVKAFNKIIDAKDQRIAVLLLLVLEESHRSRNRAALRAELGLRGISSEQYQELETRLFQLMNFVESDEEHRKAVHGIGEVVIGLVQETLSEEHQISEIDHLIEQSLGGFRVINKVDLVWMLDPLPETCLAEIANNGTKIGKALSAIELPFADIFQLLQGVNISFRNGSKSQRSTIVSSEECRAMRDFADSIQFDGEDWPSWMQKVLAPDY